MASSKIVGSQLKYLSTQLKKMSADRVQQQKFLVFVYGTLKRGEPNANIMTDPSSGSHRLVATGRTARPFPLVIASPYNIPFCLDKPNEGFQVFGEVYEVDEQKLAKLDELESHPIYYRRKIEQIFIEDGNESVDAWIYLLPKWDAEFLKTATMYMQSYSSMGAHGRKYVKSENTSSTDDIAPKSVS